MATAKEEENTTSNAQVLYVIRFQSPLWKCKYLIQTLPVRSHIHVDIALKLK